MSNSTDPKNPTPVWLLRLLHKLHSEKLNFKIELNGRDGVLSSDAAKVTLNAEKLLQYMKVSD